MGVAKSAVAAYGVGVIGFGVLVAFTLARFFELRLRARLAGRSFKRDAPLVQGDIVLAGEVEYARGADGAVAVEVDQEANAYVPDGGEPHVTWTETARGVVAQPFYVVHASGRRIRVEPGEGARLVDQLDEHVRVDRGHRKRIARLSPGERVFAFGRL